jgi:hypothetical protein
MAKYEPLTLGLIDEGRFLQLANEDLLNLQAQLATYVAQHKERADKAKAKLIIEVTLCVEKAEGDMFSVKALTKTTLPNRPPSVSFARGDETQDGVPCLGVRKGMGSDKTDPTQGKFCTDDGRIPAKAGE